MGLFSSYFFHPCMTGFEQKPISEKLSKKFQCHIKEKEDSKINHSNFLQSLQQEEHFSSCVGVSSYDRAKEYITRKARRWNAAGDLY